MITPRSGELGISPDAMRAETIAGVVRPDLLRDFGIDPQGSPFEKPELTLFKLEQMVNQAIAQALKVANGVPLTGAEDEPGLTRGPNASAQTELRDPVLDVALPTERKMEGA